MADTDPITLVHNALGALVKANATLVGTAHTPTSGLVQLENVELLDGANRDPVRQQVREGHLPELRLIPDSVALKDVRDSHKGTITVVYRWDISTGDKRPGQNLYPILWELYRSLADWGTTLRALTWNSKAFVFDTHLRGGETTLNDQEHNRNIPGWVTLLACVVQMQFDRTDLPPT